MILKSSGSCRDSKTWCPGLCHLVAPQKHSHLQVQMKQFFPSFVLLLWKSIFPSPELTECLGLKP